MKTSASLKSDRINIRLSGTVKTLLERAASVEGKTVSNYILNSALERAEETVRKHDTISLNAKNSEIFLNALSGDISFNKKLSDVLKEHSRRITSK
ncbi:MAG: DUF1778 domain-containing protein [Desulfatiglans sp.]|jgi:uncharacterized protein (DUF1778 family)|nr:DUF1778 domain-containing protein [Desulfatiglans sp.]